MNDFDPNYIPQKNSAIVGQKAIVINSENKLLLLRRSEKSGLGGKWSLPGGGLEFHEDALSSIQREIDEETKLSVSNLKPYYIKSYLDNDKDFIVIIGYICKSNTDDVVLNWEHDQFEWLAKEDALKFDLTPDGRTFIEQFAD